MAAGRCTGSARTLGIGTYEVGRLLKSLVDDGIVTIHVERPRATIAPDGIDPTAAIDEATDARADADAPMTRANGAPPAEPKPTRPLLRIGSKLARKD